MKETITIQETVAYRGEFLVVKCPYCGNKHYLDVEDDISEGFIPDSGRRMDCDKCLCTMIVVPQW